MWILTRLLPGGETHYLQSGRNYVVGRKNCDILLPEDQSISRAHTHISITEQTLTIKDSSKYGTFVNGQKLAENTPITLTSGGNITFGVFKSKFRVEPWQPVVCSSCLDNSAKASLSDALKFVGGKLVGSWSQDCTHLVMSQVKVTIKTICALLCGRPIVKPEFFSALHTAVQNKSPTPEANRFIPEINEPSLNKDKVKIGVISERRELFTGKTFVFLNAKQLLRLSAVVTCGGGSCRLLDEGSLPRDVLESAQSCVIDVTSSASQPVLSSATMDWVNSVKSIVEKKGLRVITESEIGLAAVYASCDTHCNSSRLTESESLPKGKSRIPSASLSQSLQSLAVNETVLPAPSMNITAYAANTEPSQGLARQKVSRVSAVGETPEKQPKAKKPGTEKKTESQYCVAESHNFSFNVVEQTESRQTIEESKLTEEEPRGVRQQPVFAKPNGGTKILSQKPQKTNSFGQGSPKKLSPQKQSSLTSFFQPVNKKRQLEDDNTAEMSQPKRSARDSSINSPPPETFKETRSEKGPTVALQSLRGATENNTQGQKRKDVEEIELEELESLMSQDMDFDEPPWRSQSQAKANDPKPHKEVGKAEFSGKRQRLQGKDEQDDWKCQQLEKPSTSRESTTGNIKEQNVSVNIDAFEHSEEKSEELLQMEATEVPVIKKQEDEELLKVEAIEVPVKPVIVKLQKPKMDDCLPKNVLQVEFRDLKVSEPPTKVTKPKQSNGYTKNFKCFRKVQMRGPAPVIGGADLLAHNRGRNSALDEWLKDAAEEELQSRRDESAGDDLFRYNPSKIARRR
ncbi:nibrin [Eucyclogobius newberryi]|uniref:nibrin n=1 Tax=Eucyclogobius newberryi TaxID=166745 RepID=UPI003B5A943B